MVLLFTMELLGLAAESIMAKIFDVGDFDCSVGFAGCASKRLNSGVTGNNLSTRVLVENTGVLLGEHDELRLELLSWESPLIVVEPLRSI